ncbi:hypothetical protein [Sphingomonas sp.]|uniref:hypothetical protein n=1 Tax=Sphingomonas sp. TaxID=28214 RepID=UPI002C0D010B|nr:hypothetical protein [Sphingomonas sp.]HWK37101.1 hypothetical protein [Sphingomonas sp.]
MKLIALTVAGLLAAVTVAPVPADAQTRSGWSRHHDGWNKGRRWDRGHRYRPNRRWSRGRAYTRCRWVRGQHGRYRRCYRVWR